MARADILIRGGTVVDPAREIMGPADVLSRGDRIAALAPGEKAEAETTIDATGCLVTPGLIDHHAHVFHGGTAVGCAPDATLLPMGVTTTVDPGSAGVDAAETFIRSVIRQSRMKIFCTLNVSSEGMTTRLHPEDLDPKGFDQNRLGSFLAKYPDIVLGLKVRSGAELVKEHGISSLKRALEIADALGHPLTVHVTNPPVDMGDLAAMMRPRDVICHPYHGTGNTILEGNGRVKQKVRDAQRRGVIMDTADGRRNNSHAVARAAIADGFLPDIISTDIVSVSVFNEMLFGLPVMMAKYMAFGIPLLEVIRAVTAAPAAALGMSGKIGTLAPGAAADVAILKLKDKDFRLRNGHGELDVLPKLFVPQLTILDGQVVFRQVDFF